ncbi:hypothetical protein RB597_003926 [Gaeumannomyces tritici]
MKVAALRPPSLGRLGARPRPRLEWTCAACRSSQSAGPGPGRRALHTVVVSPAAPTVRSYYVTAASSLSSSKRSFSSSPSGPGPSRSSHHHQQQHGEGPRQRSRRGGVLLATTGGAASVGLLAFTDDIKQSYEVAERCARVAVALYTNIQDYRSTLKPREEIQDHDEYNKELGACHKRCAVRTLRVLEKNGGIFIKLGQHLSAMNYLLPTEWTETFIPLQDKCPVSSFESIQEMFRADTGQELWDHFSEFSPEPIGAASLAQVHLATLKDSGRRVAVKVQHPELAQWTQLDLALTRYSFDTLKKFFPEYDLSWLSKEMGLSLPQELDFTQEALNADRAREHFARVARLPLIIPEVVSARQRILVMANESGHRLDDLEYIDSEGIDRDEVSATLAHLFNEMIFGDGAPLHCDPHGGNIAIRKREGGSRLGLRRLLGLGGSRRNFEIILYDHGLYRDIPVDIRRSYAKMWLAVVEGDMAGMRKWAGEIAGVTDETFPLFASAITGRDFGILSAAASPSSSDAGGVMAPRSLDEKQTMSGALQDGMLADLVQLLGRIPRVILLILKTNDLTRSLDENLQTRQGPVRSFLILARYCMRTVFHERLEAVRERGSLFWPPNTIRLLAAWVDFLKVELKLEAFELWLSVKRTAGPWLRGPVAIAA